MQVRMELHLPHRIGHAGGQVRGHPNAVGVASHHAHALGKQSRAAPRPCKVRPMHGQDRTGDAPNAVTAAKLLRQVQA